MNENAENDKYLKLFIEKSGALVAGVSAAVVTAFVPGFGGMLFGGLTTVVVEQTYKEIGYGLKKRLLNEREEIRISAAFTTAVSRIRERLDAGEHLRNDDFFEGETGNRAAASEILEGVLLISQREYEELKIQFYGYLLANISFDTRISRSYSNFLLRTGESLSYRQLCILQVVGRPFECGLEKKYVSSRANPAKMDSYKETNWIKLGLSRGATLPISRLDPDLREEIRNLEQRGLIEQGNSVSKNMYKIKLTNIGIDLQRLMELDKIPKDQLNPLVSAFRMEGKYS